MNDRPMIKGHAIDCPCWECIEQRKFDARVNAHIRDPKTLFVSGLFATLPTLVFGVISGGLVWWWFGKSYVVVTSLTFGLLAGLVAFGFAFYFIVLVAPWHSGYVKPGVQSPNGKQNKLAQSETFCGLPPVPVTCGVYVLGHAGPKGSECSVCGWLKHPASQPKLWGKSGVCPNCGFSYRWDGDRCSHCGHCQTS